MKAVLNNKIENIVNRGNYFSRDYSKSISQHQVEMNNSQYYYYLSNDKKDFHFIHKNGEIVLPLKDVNFEIFWDELGNVPVNEDGDIEESFEHFQAGTEVEEIWHWFEEFFDISIGEEFF